MTPHRHLPLHPLDCDCPGCAVPGPADAPGGRYLVTVLVIAAAWGVVLALAAAAWTLLRR